MKAIKTIKIAGKKIRVVESYDCNGSLVLQTEDDGKTMYYVMDRGNRRMVDSWSSSFGDAMDYCRYRTA